MRKKTTLILLILICNYLTAQNDDCLFSPMGIAELHITLADGQSISAIKNEKANADYIGKVKATMIVNNSTSSTYGEKDFYNGKILIDGRGNTSWHHDKRPYNIDLVGDDWQTEVFSALLGMPPGEEWCLLAFWEDRSLMRFQLASYLGQSMNWMGWVPRNRYVEVWINDDYRGLYALTEKIQRDKNRVDIKKLDETSTDLSGGFILEASTPDKLKPIDQAVQFRTTQDDINFTFKYPKPQNITTDQRSWIINYLNEFETVLRQSTFSDPVNGYPKYINDSSFIDWTILHELSKGCDNLFHASVFVQKDRNDKLNMSAPWDFDLSYGNSGIYTMEGTWVRSHRWFGLLYRDPVFAKKFNDRYIELMPLFKNVPRIIDSNYAQLKNSGALDREYEKFPSIINDYVNKDGNRLTPYSYKGHARYFSDWFMARMGWVYIDLAPNDSEKGKRMKTIKPVIRIMDPEDLDHGDQIEVKVMRSQDNSNKNKYSWNDASFGYDWYRTISQKGKYWVKIKDEWGNISLASDTLYFGVAAPDVVTEVSKLAEMNMTFTNPAQERIEIDITFAANITEVNISLLDMQGKECISQKHVMHSGHNSVLFQVSSCQRGMYILRLQSNQGTITRKIVLN